jgi:hypothetical protein
LTIYLLTVVNDEEEIVAGATLALGRSEGLEAALSFSQVSRVALFNISYGRQLSIQKNVNDDALLISCGASRR